MHRNNINKTLRMATMLCLMVVLFVPSAAWAMVSLNQGNPVNANLITPSGTTLSYSPYDTATGDKLGDYSFAGFYGGEKELPKVEDLEVVHTLTPSGDPNADDRERIQAAIDDASRQAGADKMVVVLLKKGTYNISEGYNSQGNKSQTGLYLKSGVVLLGEGQGPNGTILRATDASKYTLIYANGQTPTKSATTIDITDDYVKAGSYTFTVADGSSLNEGDLILITHPSSKAWASALKMDTIVTDDSNGKAASWSGTVDMTTERTIVAKNGNEITVDIPLYVPLDKSLTQSHVRKMDDSRRLRHFGVQNMRLESAYDPSVTTNLNGVTYKSDENHAKTAICIARAKDGFVRNVTTKYFYIFGFDCDTDSKQITIQNCSVLEPVAKLDGGRRYGFGTAHATQQILYVGCYTDKNRHSYLSSYPSTGPVAFVDSVADNPLAASEGHGTWSTGMLFDNIYQINEPHQQESGIALANRGKWGSKMSQGWSSAGSVVWNSLSRTILVSKPQPTAGLTYNNFAIGVWGVYGNGRSTGTNSTNYYKALADGYKGWDIYMYRKGYKTESGVAVDANFATANNTPMAGDGYKESPTTPVNPRSLFKAQLGVRVNNDYTTARPNGPILDSPDGDSTNNNGNSFTVEGYAQKGAGQVTIYVDDVATAVTPAGDGTFKQTITPAEAGWHKVYATQTIDGVESTKTADRFTRTGADSNNNIDRFANVVDYDDAKMSLLTRDSRERFGTTVVVPEYTIKFDANNGEGTMNDLSMVYGTAQNLTANAFHRTGYTFKEWNTQADGMGTAYANEASVNNLTETDGGTVTLYAQWKANTYTVKFDANTGFGAMNEQTMTYDESANLTACSIIKIGSTFEGWNTKADGSGTAYADGTSVTNLAAGGTVTLYAQWTQKDITIEDIPAQTYTGSAIEPPLTIESDGTVLTPTVDYDVEYSDNIEPGKAKATVTFKGNYSGTKIVEFTIKNTSYTIAFDANKGSGTMDPLPMEYGTAKALTANRFTRDGYTFKEWNTKADGTGTAYKDKGSVNNLTTTNNGTVTLYAQWTGNTYVVTYKANGGTGDDIVDTVTMGSPWTVRPATTFHKTGYTMIYWVWTASDDDAGETLIPGTTTSWSLLANITAHAQWDANTYTVKFDANTGFGAMNEQTMTYDESANLTANSYTKPNHTFAGWNRSADGSGAAYADEQSVSNLTENKGGTVTLYAQWRQNDITIEDIPDQPYTGQKIEPPLTIKSEGKLLIPEVDYDVEYSDNIQPGTAKATVTFKGNHSGSTTVLFTIKDSFRAKGQWVSKHEATYVTFNWTGTPNNNLATAWDVQYRTKLIGTQNPWSSWVSSQESGTTLSKRVYLKPNHTIEFKVKHETDPAYLRSVFTTPAGGKYQSITQCRVKVVATASGAAYRQGTKTLALKTGINFSGDTGNTIYVKKGTAIKITPNHVYPRSNFSKYPRLYPNHAWYDVANKSIVSLSGMNSTAGMMDSAITIRGLNAGMTTIKITSCNGRGATLTIVVK